MLLQQRQFDRAIAEFDQVIKLKPNDAVSWINRGAAYRQKGRFDTALQDYDRAISINPGSADAYTGRAQTFEEKERYDFDAFQHEGIFEDRAIADYTKLSQLQAKDPGPYYMRAHAYLIERKYDLAIADYTQAINLAPNSAVFLKARAETYTTTKKNDLAIADYRKTLTLRFNPFRAQVETALRQLGASP